MKFRRDKKVKPGIGGTLDLTPIVDVVFNLLIFFALTLNFAATSGGINVKLPTASSAEPIKSEQLTINLAKDDKIYLNDKSTNLEELSETLSDNKEKETLVIIRADDSIPHGKVVRVMDIVRSNDFSRLAIAVQQSASEESK